MQKTELAVVIGRFQPLHNGHINLIKEALRSARRVLILVGSARGALSIKNPWTFEARRLMIASSFPMEVGSQKIVIEPLEDIPYNDDLWVSKAQRKVSIYCSNNKNVILVGHSKDSSTYYLNLFPQWGFKEIEYNIPIDATEVREAVFENNTELVYKYLPKRSIELCTILRENKVLIEEYNFIKEYRKQWENSPYPPTFLTVDAVVIQQGHVLLVRRGELPGRGKLALPGGFLNQEENLEDAMIRELREETCLKVPEKVLKGSIVENRVFDDPNRSLRGRTVTQAYLIHLTETSQGLPKVKGADDAEKAFFAPIGTLRPEEFYEDHYHIINKMLGYI